MEDYALQRTFLKIAILMYIKDNGATINSGNYRINVIKTFIPVG